MGVSTEAKSDVVKQLFAEAGLEPPDDTIATSIFDAAVTLAVLKREPEGTEYLRKSIRQASGRPLGALSYLELCITHARRAS